MACSRVLNFSASMGTLAGTEEQSPLQIGILITLTQWWLSRLSLQGLLQCSKGAA
jgi:hypothetical protein